MALKAVLTREEYDALPANRKELYIEKDGKFVLDAEGVEDVTGLKTALENERRDRREASRKLKEITDKFADMNPEEARAAIAKLQELEDKGLIDAGKLDELVNKRVSKMQETYDKKVKDLETENAGLKTNLSEVLIDGSLREAAVKAGVRPTAIADVIYRGQRVFRLKDGKPVPMNGEDVIYGPDAKTPMAMDEWLKGLQTDAPHLFNDSTGGGSPNKAATSGSGKIVRLTREQAYDPQQYRAARDQAAKVGGQVEIV